MGSGKVCVVHREEFSKWLKKYAELFYKTFSHRVKNLEL
jgi:hypothetical protein